MAEKEEEDGEEGRERPLVTVSLELVWFVKGVRRVHRRGQEMGKRGNTRPASVRNCRKSSP